MSHVSKAHQRSSLRDLLMIGLANSEAGHREVLAALQLIPRDVLVDICAEMGLLVLVNSRATKAEVASIIATTSSRKTVVGSPTATPVLKGGKGRKEEVVKDDSEDNSVEVFVSSPAAVSSSSKQGAVQDSKAITVKVELKVPEVTN